ncbi:hypothetical protein VPHF86_0214 [Vibrio phage F86]
MNKSVNVVRSLAGVYMPTTYELAQNFYDANVQHSDTYVDSVRRTVAKELREGVESGLLSRVQGKKFIGSTKFAHRYTCRDYANKIGLVNIGYKDTHAPSIRTGVIALIEKCIAEMVIDKTYRHKKFTSNASGVLSVMSYIHEQKTTAAQMLVHSHGRTLEKNVKYVVRNHRGILDDK